MSMYPKFRFKIKNQLKRGGFIKHKKSQSVTEFLVIFGFLVIAFIVFISFISHSLKNMSEKREMILIKDIGTFTQKEIILASEMKDGYFRQFRLPEKYKNIDYDIEIINSTLIVKSQKSIFEQEFSLPYVVGQPKKGINNITKKEGIVYLN